MTMVARTVEVERIERHTLALDGAAIRGILKKAGYDVPHGARITFTVPTGGDWSGETIDVDKDTPISVRWEVKDFK